MKLPRLSSYSPVERERLLARIEYATQLPLMVLAFILIPLIVGLVVWDLRPTEREVFIGLGAAIWSVFLAALLAKLVVSPRRWRFLKENWVDIMIVVVPFLRPLWVLLPFLAGRRAFVGARRLLGADFLLGYLIGLLALAATVITSVEAGAPNATIRTFGDGLWWAVVTVGTVGYGDLVPVTTAGRIVGVFLIIGGVGFFTGFTANFASYLVRRDLREKRRSGRDDGGPRE